MSDRAFPRFLVSTGWLAAHLTDPRLRVFDCSVRLVPDPVAQYLVEDCRWDYRDGHIPGAAYIDLHNDLSDPSSDLRFMMPSKEHMERALSAYGIGNDSLVVLYAKGTYYWATRVWWMLRACGFDNAVILDGAWQKWVAEGRPVSTGEERYPPARFTARPRALFCAKGDVLAAIGARDAIIVNALTREQHEGTGGTTFERPGHIAGSVNVVSKDLVDPATNAFLPLDEIRRRFEAAGVLQNDKRAILYCGGGISATGNAFALAMLGREDVTVYDGSLNEWGADPSLPMETGA